MATYKDTIPVEIIDRCEKTIQWCMETLRRKLEERHLLHKYARFNVMPNLIFKKRGGCAGTADVIKWEINLNKVYLLENTEHMIEDTLLHEFVHLVQFVLYPYAKRQHGPEFKKVSKWLFGREFSTYHTYNTSNARKPRRKVRYVYQCQCGPVLLTKRQHDVTQTCIEKGSGAGYICGKCGDIFREYVGEKEFY